MNGVNVQVIFQAVAPFVAWYIVALVLAGAFRQKWLVKLLTMPLAAAWKLLGQFLTGLMRLGLDAISGILGWFFGGLNRLARRIFRLPPPPPPPRPRPRRRHHDEDDEDED